MTNIYDSDLGAEWTDTWNAKIIGTIHNPDGATIENDSVWIYDSNNVCIGYLTENCGVSSREFHQWHNIVSDIKSDGLSSGTTYHFVMSAHASDGNHMSGVGCYTTK